MANTFVPIATTTVGSGGAANITFSNIPQTYTDLLIKISGRTSNAYYRDSVEIRPNGATANRSQIFLIAQGTTIVSGPQSSIYVEIEGDTVASNIFGNADIYIPNYAGSAQKAMSTTSNTESNAAADNAMYFGAQLWADTAPITSIVLVSASWLQYSTATLYGIKTA